MTEENFALNHATLTDAELLALPAEPISPLLLFVCTYVARLGLMHMNGEELTKRVAAALQVNAPGGVLAVNSNYGHACLAGYEFMLKLPTATPRGPLHGRPRKGQGDTTCFNSAVELTLRIAGATTTKVYKTKLFSTTGEAQVPGVICTDLSDGHAALVTLIDFLNSIGAGDLIDPEQAAAQPQWSLLRKQAEEAVLAGDALAIERYLQRLSEHIAQPLVPGSRHPVQIDFENAKMLNYKLHVNRSSPRMLVNLSALSTYLSCLERSAPEITDAALLATLSTAFNMVGTPVLVRPPFPVRETNPPTDDVKVSFRFRCGSRAPRINVFQGGKINILGADSIECAARIYEFFQILFRDNWNLLICLQPRRDVAAPQRAPRPRREKVREPEAKPKGPKGAKLSDIELEKVLSKPA